MIHRIIFLNIGQGRCSKVYESHSKASITALDNLVRFNVLKENFFKKRNYSQYSDKAFFRIRILIFDRKNMWIKCNEKILYIYIYKTRIIDRTIDMHGIYIYEYKYRHRYTANCHWYHPQYKLSHECFDSRSAMLYIDMYTRTDPSNIRTPKNPRWWCTVEVCFPKCEFIEFICHPLISRSVTFWHFEKQNSIVCHRCKCEKWIHFFLVE